MPLENANTIVQLDEQWPNGSDSIDRGDDHIRLIKSVLKKTFRGPAGTGFSTPLTVDPALLNELSKTLTDMKAAITNAQAVGNIIFRDDAVDPATLYPGTVWTLLTGDACIALATAQNAGNTSGENNPVVPLPLHSHGVNLSGNANHNHYLFTGTPNNYGTPAASAPNNRIAVTGIKRQFTDRDDYMLMETAGGGNCGVSETTILNVGISGNTGDAGTPSATIDVRGKRKYLCAWKRVK